MTRCLVVDDNPLAVAVLSAMLRDLGCTHVRVATDGPHALEILRAANGDVDLLLCDVDMPGMDGVEVIRNVAASIAHPPLVVPVSDADPALLRAASALAQARKLRVAGSLRKPVARTALASILAGLPKRDSGVRRAEDKVPPRTLSATELEDALVNRRLAPWFQPKVQLRDGTITGFEALARIVTVDGTVLPPAAFLPAVTSAALARTFTEVLAESVARWMSTWRRAGHHFGVSLNVWPSTFENVDLCDALTDTFAAFGVPASNVVLEVTEADAVVSAGNMLDNLIRFRLRGFGVSIDDFGTGHSTLEKLRDFPFSELKIDQGFVRRAQNDPITRHIVECTASLARALELTTVAEGIETEADLAFMHQLAIDQCQGYLVSRPMPAEAVQDFLSARDVWTGAEATAIAV